MLAVKSIESPICADRCRRKPQTSGFLRHGHGRLQPPLPQAWAFIAQGRKLVIFGQKILDRDISLIEQMLFITVAARANCLRTAESRNGLGGFEPFAVQAPFR